VVPVGDTGSEVPEPSGVPPQLPLYQSTVWPTPTEADNVEELPLQIVAGLACGFVGSAGTGFTVTVTVQQVLPTQPVVVFLVRA